MITGAHTIIFTADPEGARTLFADVLGLPSVDAGGGWLIFALPPSELALHPVDAGPRHELFLMCDRIEETVDELQHKGVQFTRPIGDEPWGRITAFRLPGGEELALYEPRHPSPVPAHR